MGKMKEDKRGEQNKRNSKHSKKIWKRKDGGWGEGRMRGEGEGEGVDGRRGRG